MGKGAIGRWGVTALALLLLFGGGWAAAQDEKKPAKGKKKPAAEMDEPKKPAKEKGEKPAEGEKKEKSDDEPADDPVYAKKLKKLRQDIEKAFKKPSKGGAVYVYTHTERRTEIDEGTAKGKFTGAKQTLVPVIEKVCKQSEDREQAIEDTYKFVAEYPPFEKKAKKEKGKKNVMEIGAPPRPVREWGFVGMFKADDKGKLAAAAAKERAEKEIDQIERAQKAAADARKKGKK
jgi:hypothetical protein